MSENNNNMNGKDFLIGALVGGIIGASAALLLTPKTGRELRVNISDGYQTASKKTKDLAKQVGEKSEFITGKVKEVAGNVKEDFQKFKSSVGTKAEEVIDERVEPAAEFKGEVAATVDEVPNEASDDEKSKSKED